MTRSVSAILFGCLVLVSGLAIIAAILLQHDRTEKYWRKRAHDILSRAKSLEPVQNYKDGYHLSNLIKRRRDEGDKEFYTTHFPYSIMSEYMSKTDKNDYDVLAEIVESRSKQDEIPMNDELVVYLSPIDRDLRDIAEILASCNPQADDPMPFFSFAIRLGDMRRAARHVTILAEQGGKKNLKYVAAIHQFFLDEGFQVDMRIGGDIDEHFVFACNANLLIACNDDFAYLASNIKSRLSIAPMCKWVVEDRDIVTENLEHDPEKLWGRKILLEILERTGLKYHIAYGTLLGALRHKGIMENDGDCDVILSSKSKQLHGLNDRKQRVEVARLIHVTAEREFPEYSVRVYFNAYKDKLRALYGRDKIPRKLVNFACTATIWKKDDDWEDKEKYSVDHLNYPHVMDVELPNKKHIKRFGPKCMGVIKDEQYPAFEGGHSHCMNEYGHGYMQPKSATKTMLGRSYNDRETWGQWFMRRRCKWYDPVREDKLRLLAFSR